MIAGSHTRGGRREGGRRALAGLEHLNLPAMELTGTFEFLEGLGTLAVRSLGFSSAARSAAIAASNTSYSGRLGLVLNGLEELDQFGRQNS